MEQRWRGKAARIWITAIAIADLLLGATMAATGVMVLTRAGTMIRGSGAPEEFGSAMLFASGGLVLAILGGLGTLASLGFLWLSRRARSGGRPGGLGWLLLCLATTPTATAAVLLAILGWRALAGSIH